MMPTVLLVLQLEVFRSGKAWHRQTLYLLQNGHFKSAASRNAQYAQEHTLRMETSKRCA